VIRTAANNHFGSKGISIVSGESTAARKLTLSGVFAD